MSFLCFSEMFLYFVMYYLVLFFIAPPLRMVASDSPPVPSVTLDLVSFRSASDLLPDKQFLLDSFYGISRIMCILKCTKRGECQSAGFGQQTCMLFSVSPATEMKGSSINQPFQHNAHFTLFFRETQATDLSILQRAVATLSDY